MDINYFLRCEQIERVRADRADSRLARTAHLSLADRYGALIAAHRVAGDKPALASRRAVA